jgi:hypothetical protein
VWSKTVAIENLKRLITYRLKLRPDKLLNHIYALQSCSGIYIKPVDGETCAKSRMARYHSRSFVENLPSMSLFLVRNVLVKMLRNFLTELLASWTTFLLSNKQKAFSVDEKKVPEAG